MKRCHLIPALALCATLGACKPSVKSLRTIDINEIALHEQQSELRSPLDAEARALVEHYLHTGDARYASPEHGLTLLHLAAMTHRLWLVDKLLAEGADPNALAFRNEASPGDTPAALAVRCTAWKLTNEDALLIVKALMAKGADINSGDGILNECAAYGGDGDAISSYDWRPNGKLSREGLAIELMKLGAKPNSCLVVNCSTLGWPKALKALMETPEWASLRQNMPEYLMEFAHSFSRESRQYDCLKLLLQEATAEEVRGTAQENVLFSLLNREPESAFDGRHLNKPPYGVMAVALLLEHGADPLMPCGAFGMTCAADAAARDRHLQEKLRERGVTLTPPPHRFEADSLVEQLLDIPVEAIRHEEAAAQYELIASLFTAPTEAMFAHKLLYRQACSQALALLYRTDTDRTMAMLKALPAWRDAAVWEGDAHAARGLLIALRDNKNIILPVDFLLKSADAMEEAGRPDVAHAWRRLLSQDKANENFLQQLCNEKRPLPVLAAVQSCMLELAERPTLGSVESWMKDQYSYDGEYNKRVQYAIAAERSMRCVHKLAPLTMPERLFYQPDDSEGSATLPTPEQQAKTIEALRHIGAPLAAALCGDPEPATPSPEVAALAQRFGTEAAASLELEYALSGYLLRHWPSFCQPWWKGGDDGE